MNNSANNGLTDMKFGHIAGEGDSEPVSFVKTYRIFVTQGALFFGIQPYDIV